MELATWGHEWEAEQQEVRGQSRCSLEPERRVHLELMESAATRTLCKFNIAMENHNFQWVNPL